MVAKKTWKVIEAALTALMFIMRYDRVLAYYTDFLLHLYYDSDFAYHSAKFGTIILATTYTGYFLLAVAIMVAYMNGEEFTGMLEKVVNVTGTVLYIALEVLFYANDSHIFPILAIVTALALAIIFVLDAFALV